MLPIHPNPKMHEMQQSNHNATKTLYERKGAASTSYLEISPAVAAITKDLLEVEAPIRETMKWERSSHAFTEIRRTPRAEEELAA